MYCCISESTFKVVLIDLCLYCYCCVNQLLAVMNDNSQPLQIYERMDGIVDIFASHLCLSKALVNMN